MLGGLLHSPSLSLQRGRRLHTGAGRGWQVLNCAGTCIQALHCEVYSTAQLRRNYDVRTVRVSEPQPEVISTLCWMVVHDWRRRQCDVRTVRVSAPSQPGVVLAALAAHVKM